MLILAFDTSTSKGGVAVASGSKILSRKVWARGKSHSELLTPAVEDCLNEAGLSIKDVQILAVGIGPGSFTGIRVGINAAKTIGFALDLPIMAFTTGEVLAAGAFQNDHPVLTLVNAHKNLLYTAAFAPGANGKMVQTGEIEALSVEEIDRRIQAPHICVGDGYEAYANHLPKTLHQRLIRRSEFSDEPDPATLALLASSQDPQSRALDWKTVQPLYIRSSEAEEKLREGLLKTPFKL